MESEIEKPKRPSDKELISQGFKRTCIGWRKKTRLGVIVWYDPVKTKPKKRGKRDKLVPKLYVTK